MRELSRARDATALLLLPSIFTLLLLLLLCNDDRNMQDEKGVSILFRNVLASRYGLILIMVEIEASRSARYFDKSAIERLLVSVWGSQVV